MIETINPTDKQHWLECRTKDITSTEISGLFGFSPYTTEFEIWHTKKAGTIVEIAGNERMKWGTALQDAIAAEIAKEQGWTIRRMDEYMRDTDLRAGASFDFSIESLGGITNNQLDELKDNGITVRKGLLEIKNVDSLAFRDGWTEDDAGNIEAPLHIEIQVQHQLMVSGRAFAYIGALVGGNRLVLIKRDRNDAVINSIQQKIQAFWASIESNTPPKPNFERDAKFISSLYNYADPGKLLDVRENEDFMNMAREHKRLGDIAKDAETKREALKAQMLMVIGDAEKIEGGEFSISAGIIGECEVAYTRKAYRNFKPTWRKPK